MRRDEKVSLLMILKRPVEESHHIFVVKEPRLKKIFPRVLKDPKVRELYSYQQLTLKLLLT